jgi:hypothetical protein
LLIGCAVGFGMPGDYPPSKNPSAFAGGFLSPMLL